MRHLVDAFEAIDRANAEDPTDFNGEPLALVQGQRASSWLDKLVDKPSVELQIAARAHHLRRWEIARSDYEDGRNGYLRWRRENKQHQAASAADLLAPLGIPEPSIAQVQDLLVRKGLGTNPETQTLEDAVCLVFVETQFDQLTDRLDHDHMVSVVRKTLKKMSSPAIALAAECPMSTKSAAVLADAVAGLQEEATA